MPPAYRMATAISSSTTMPTIFTILYSDSLCMSVVPPQVMGCKLCNTRTRVNGSSALWSRPACKARRIACCPFFKRRMFRISNFVGDVVGQLACMLRIELGMLLFLYAVFVQEIVFGVG